MSAPLPHRDIVETASLSSREINSKFRNNVSTLFSDHKKGQLALPYYEKPVIDVSAQFAPLGHNLHLSGSILILK